MTGVQTCALPISFFPLLFWPGIIGKFMIYLPAMLIFTLAASLVVAFIMNPVFAVDFMNHTDDEEVFAFLSKYTEWKPFKLQPKGHTKLGLISLPYSKKTISEIGRELSQEEIRSFLFKDYSEKQWGVDFESIPLSITNRIPKTANCEDPTWFEEIGRAHV